MFVSHFAHTCSLFSWRGVCASICLHNMARPPALFAPDSLPPLDNFYPQWSFKNKYSFSARRRENCCSSGAGVKCSISWEIGEERWQSCHSANFSGCDNFSTISEPDPHPQHLTHFIIRAGCPGCLPAPLSRRKPDPGSRMAGWPRAPCTIVNTRIQTLSVQAVDKNHRFGESGRWILLVKMINDCQSLLGFQSFRPAWDIPIYSSTALADTVKTLWT